MSDGGHQMSFAKANATIDEERIVFFARPLGDRQRGGVGELVARPNYELCKGEAGIQFGARWIPSALICAGSRCDGCFHNVFRRSIFAVAAAITVRTVAPAWVFAHSQTDLDEFPHRARKPLLH